MSAFDENPDVSGGGHARASGGCYHLSFRSGSRGRGSCARAAHDYITRREEYDDPDRDEAVYTESGNMPSWAEEDARGRKERVDHRSYERQGIDREPGEHYGPAAAQMVSRGVEHNRLGEAAVSLDVQDAIRSIARDIEVLERPGRFELAAERADARRQIASPAAP